MQTRDIQNNLLRTEIGEYARLIIGRDLSGDEIDRATFNISQYRNAWNSNTKNRLRWRIDIQHDVLSTKQRKINRGIVDKMLEDPRYLSLIKEESFLSGIRWAIHTSLIYEIYHDNRYQIRQLHDQEIASIDARVLAVENLLDESIDKGFRVFIHSEATVEATFNTIQTRLPPELSRLILPFFKIKDLVNLTQVNKEIKSHTNLNIN